MQRILRYRLQYVVFGVLFFVFWFLFKVGGNPNVASALLSTSVDVAISMAALFLTVEVLLPKVVYARRYGLFALLFALLVLCFGTMIILTQLKLNNTSLAEYHANVAKSPKHFYYWFWADLIFGSYVLVFFISSTGAAVRFAFDRVHAINAVERLQKEKLSAELDLLKNQVNPHFLFNALNTVFYKIDRANQPARDTLERFSKMLRYQLYECNTAMVPVEKELAFLASYIELQKERLDNNYAIHYTGFDTVKDAGIRPFLLMPLVENCFKHISTRHQGENRICIACALNGGTFTLQTANSCEDAATLGTHGIGLENVRRQLALLYPGKHSLVIKKENGLFELWLKISLT